MPDKDSDQIEHRRRSAPKCVYCGEPRQYGQMCNKCKNDSDRREHYDPVRVLYKKFLGV